MFFHVQRLINEIVPDEPDPAAANALQEGLGGQFGEMRTMMQYLFQAMNFRGPAGKPYRDLIQGIGTEEISHVELIGTTISRLLDGSPRYQGKPTDPLDKPGAGGATPLSIALDEGNIHHYLVGAQGALPVDAAGNPWSGSYVYNSGNLPLDLLYNLMLESTGRLQKCRIYEMTDNATARSTIAYLIVRDQAHENAYAKALETLGVNWKTLLPIPKTNAERFPEVKRCSTSGCRASSTRSTSPASRRRAGSSRACRRRRTARPRRERAGAGRRAVDDRARAPRGVLARPRPGPPRTHAGDRRDGDGGGRAALRADPGGCRAHVEGGYGTGRGGDGGEVGQGSEVDRGLRQHRARRRTLHAAVGRVKGLRARAHRPRLAACPQPPVRPNPCPPQPGPRPPPEAAQRPHQPPSPPSHPAPRRPSASRR